MIVDVPFVYGATARFHRKRSTGPVSVLDCVAVAIRDGGDAPVVATLNGPCMDPIEYRASAGCLWAPVEQGSGFADLALAWTRTAMDRNLGWRCRSLLLAQDPVRPWDVRLDHVRLEAQFIADCLGRATRRIGDVVEFDGSARDRAVARVIAAAETSARDFGGVLHRLTAGPSQHLDETGQVWTVSPDLGFTEPSERSRALPLSDHDLGPSVFLNDGRRTLLASGLRFEIADPVSYRECAFDGPSEKAVAEAWVKSGNYMDIAVPANHEAADCARGLRSILRDWDGGRPGPDMLAAVRNGLSTLDILEREFDRHAVGPCRMAAP